MYEIADKKLTSLLTEWQSHFCDHSLTLTDNFMGELPLVKKILIGLALEQTRSRRLLKGCSQPLP